MLQDPRGRNRVALVCMVGTVLFHSLIPLFIFMTGGVEHPFLFIGGYRVGLGLGCLAVLLPFFHHLFRLPHFFYSFWRSFFTWTLFWATLQCFDYAAFSWATRLLDVSVVNILFGLWPILFILVVSRLFRGMGWHQTNIRAILPGLLVAAVGVGMVVLSETDQSSSLGFLLSPSHMIGVALALVSALLVSLGGFGFLWGKILLDKLSIRGTELWDVRSCYFFGAVLGLGVSSFLGGSANLVLAAIFPVEHASGDILWWGLLGGLLLSTTASVLLRGANILSDNLAVNAFMFAVPALGLCWLFLASAVHVARPGYLVAGALMIVVANVLVRLEVGQQLGDRVCYACWTVRAYSRIYGGMAVRLGGGTYATAVGAILAAFALSRRLIH